MKKWEKDLNRHFSKEDIQMANKRMKRRSMTLLIITETQIKATMQYLLTLVRMAIIKKSTNNKSCRGCGIKVTLLYNWWECKQLPWKKYGDSLKKTRNKLPRNPTSRHIP